MFEGSIKKEIMSQNNLQRFRLNVNDRDVYINDITSICDILRFCPKHIIEIGVGTYEGVSTINLIKNRVTAIVFEPHPSFYKNIVEHLGNTPGLQIINKGIYKEKGAQKFYDKWASTFIGVMYDHSGAKAQDKYEIDEKDAFICEVDTIDNYDNGEVDLLCMDCESCEWFVLEKLISRPTIVQIETHSFYSDYQPFNIDKIRQWFEDNDYGLFALNESDSIFVKKEKLENADLNIQIC